MSTPLSDTYKAGTEYLLTRDKSELERLNLQHKFVTILLSESRLIYDSSVVLAPGNKVLDAGTGTGIWLQELSKQVPDAVDLVGCDVSANNFPTQHATNIRFHTASVTDLPKDWSDTYDFVSQRLLLCGLRASEWPTVLSELHRVLKPGGHIQLMECDFKHLINPGPATKRFMDHLAELFEKAGLLLDASKQLESMMKEARFEEVKSEKKYLVFGSAWGRIGDMGKRNFPRGFRNMGPAFIKHGVISSEKELDSLVSECEEEWDSEEEGFRVISHIITARKPLN